MRELAVKSHGAHLAFIDFDALQLMAIESVFGALGTEVGSGKLDQVRIYRLTTSNFQELFDDIESDKACNSQKIIVSEIGKLSLLGKKESDLDSRILIIGIQQFSELIRNLAKNKSIYEAVLGLSLERNTFFNQSFVTDQQLELLLHIAEGRTNSEISKLMFLTEKGVEAAIHRLSHKLECDYTPEAPKNLRVLLGRRYAQMLGVFAEEGLQDFR